jgi:hypothetical protein
MASIDSAIACQTRRIDRSRWPLSGCDEQRIRQARQRYSSLPSRPTSARWFGLRRRPDAAQSVRLTQRSGVNSSLRPPSRLADDGDGDECALRYDITITQMQLRQQMTLVIVPLNGILLISVGNYATTAEETSGLRV